jgi:hypothetical protein
MMRAGGALRQRRSPEIDGLMTDLLYFVYEEATVFGAGCVVWPGRSW